MNGLIAKDRMRRLEATGQASSHSRGPIGMRTAKIPAKASSAGFRLLQLCNVLQASSPRRRFIVQGPAGRASAAAREDPIVVMATENPEDPSRLQSGSTVMRQIEIQRCADGDFGVLRPSRPSAANQGMFP